QVGDLFPTGRPSNVGMHSAALDRSRANQRNLDYQVIAPARPPSRQSADLGAAFNLENADRISTAQHVIDAGLLFGHAVERPALPYLRCHEVEGVLDSGQNAEP